MQKKRKIPLRICVSCKERFDKRELLRIVKPKEEDITIDPTGKKAGRGCYICKKRNCLENAVKNKQIERALEAPLPDGFLEMALEYVEDE